MLAESHRAKEHIIVFAFSVAKVLSMLTDVWLPANYLEDWKISLFMAYAVVFVVVSCLPII